MQLIYLQEVFELIASGRLQGFHVRRHETNPRLLRIRVRAHNRSDELWVDASVLDDAENQRALIENILNTLIDQVSPG